MRLALDVIVYFGVIAVFVTKVMVLEEAGTITPWELLWLVYLLGAVWQQVGGCVCAHVCSCFCILSIDCRNLRRLFLFPGLNHVGDLRAPIP